MSKQVGKSQKRYKPNYLYAILSTGIVLFLFGIFGLIAMYSNNLSKHFKEQIRISVELHDKHKESEKSQLQSYLQEAEFTKELTYISKEDALKRLQEDSNFENVEELIGYNPLYNSFELYIFSDYAESEKLSDIKNRIRTFTCVKNIFHVEALIEDINELSNKVGYVALGLGLFILIVTLTLINSTVRLSMYSQRFIIKNMQLVGAKSFFIIRPFIIKGLTNGFLSSALASIMIIGLVRFSESRIENLPVLKDPIHMLILLGAVLFIGIFISTVSTWFAVKKYIKMKLDDLY